jgi:menaquinone-specific isochorismate synthase
MTTGPRTAACVDGSPRSAADLLAIAAANRGTATFYWEHPREAVAILGLGVAREIRARGRGRFADASRSARAILTEIRAHDADAEPIVVGGFGFADGEATAPEWRDFPAARLFVPERCWVLRDGHVRFTRVAPSGSATAAAPCAGRATTPTVGEESERAIWRRRVAAATTAIRAGSLTKVVLARRRVLERRPAIDPVSVVTFARDRRPRCYNFWIGLGETSLVGSSPERLVRLAGRRVLSGALAGSIRRGADADEDRRLGAELLASAKNSREHALVVEAVQEALRDVVRPLAVAPRPELVAFPESFHLFTPIEGELATALDAIELAGRLHPTPAVCGTPRAAALWLIDRDEPDRGWYGGAVGWMGADGSGEFTVAIRSALIDGPRVVLWAGAGIVEGSDPESERAEIDDKMHALESALGPSTRDDDAAA